MDIIELEHWRPLETEPRKMEYAGQRTADEVFAELKHRLEGMGYLPDEYFNLRSDWEDGKMIPRGADVFCTVDYGASEGVYVDVYLKWYDKAQEKSVTSSFIIGKTLGENGNDLDRMFLTASAITKAFHGDHATHARYMKIGGVEEDTGGEVVHLSQQEQKVIIEALVEQRERQEQAMSQTEQVLRRLTGSITTYMETVGHRPLRLSDYDKTVLAIRDGEFPVFKDLYLKAMDHAGDLLIEAAGRPGIVGRKMTHLLLEDVEQFPETIYRAACQKAIDINDPEKVFFLLEQADNHVENLSPSFYGEMAKHAYADHRILSREMIQHCTNEQIAAAPPYLLELFAYGPDYQILETLVEKGISSTGSAARTLHMLTYEAKDRWVAKELLQERMRMWVDTNDYGALHACVKNDAVEVCKLLLDRGIDFEGYQRWAEKHFCSGHEETVHALAEHWTELREAAAQESAQPETGGMTFG